MSIVAELGRGLDLAVIVAHLLINGSAIRGKHDMINQRVWPMQTYHPEHKKLIEKGVS